MQSLSIVAAIVALALMLHRGLPSIGRPLRIVDGDSIEIRRFGRVDRIRLIGIDAPEYHQAHGREARSALSSLVKRRTVLVLPAGRDVYGRLAARLIVRGGCVSCALAIRGHAWGERPLTIVLATIARIRRRGLWASPTPSRPRIWRLARQRHGLRHIRGA